MGNTKTTERSSADHGTTESEIAKQGTTPEDEFKPSKREVLHDNQELCRLNLERVVPTVPLEIRPSKIDNTGSGLFVGSEIGANSEIYRVVPMMHALKPGNDHYCHHCLKDTEDMLGRPPQTVKAMPCTGCKVARYCSKQCQKLAWGLYHRDECRILKHEPAMASQTLLTHRLIFWQQRGYLTTPQAKTLMLLESHFEEHTAHSELAEAIFDIGNAIREATGKKVQPSVPWRLLTVMRTNCIPLRPAKSIEDVIGYAFDMVTAMINHSCAPNAFITFEGSHLRVRSLKPIAAGEEITVSYADPSIPVFNRQRFLKDTFFFECRCKGCEDDQRVQLALAGAPENIPKLQEIQQQMIETIAYAVRTSQSPGSCTPDIENLESVETKLRTITAAAFLRNEPYLEHVQPLPSIRRSLAMLYLEKGKPIQALRNALKGCLRKSDRVELRWVNDMIDPVYTALLVAGSLPPDAPAFKDKAFPSALELRVVTLGYILAVANEAVRVFGDDCEYAKGLLDMATTLGAQKPPPNPGTAEFAAEFVPAQRKLLAWAGLSEDHIVTIPGMQRSG
ncbi:hypothetical protein VTH06DRAFT_3139 [Thermothelomyces fergusii]